MSDGSGQGSGIGCHAPGCLDRGQNLAYDEMFHLNIAFCDEHIDEWTDTDHISRGGS